MVQTDKSHSQKPPSRTELKNNLSLDKADQDNKIFDELHSKRMI